MAEKRDTVTFTNIQKSYPPGEKLVISYGLHTDLTPSSRDWVGLFRVGWTSSRDYYTFEWAPTPQEQMGQVIFAGRRLPPEDTHFYQVCYVTSDGRVRGASPPFQFLSTSISCCLDDLELVEVSEDSIMVLQHKENVEEELSTVNASMKQLEIQHKEVTERLETVETETVQKSEQLVEKDTRIAELKQQLQAASETNKLLKETLEKERAQNHELFTAKADDETQLGIVSQQLAVLQAEINSYRSEIEGLKADLEDVKQQLQIKNNQVADLTQLASARGEEKEQVSEELARVTAELMEVRGVQADQLEQLNGKSAEIDRKSIELEARNAENERLQGEVEQLQQEVIIAHQNIAELMGAGPNAVVIDQPTTQEPPTLAEPKEIVDKAIYDALLQAYDNMEDYYRSAMKDIEILNKQLQEMKASYQLKNDELTARVEQCRLEYEALAIENHELKKGDFGAGNEALKARIAELEETNEQMTVSCETAIEELSARKVELKEKDERITDIEETLKQVECEFEKFQDKHDKVVHDKTTVLEEQQAILDEKLQELIATTQAKTALEKDKAKLETTVGQLRSQLEALKTAAVKPNRKCPVCLTVFPCRMTQRDFEQHVQGHFSGQ